MVEPGEPMRDRIGGSRSKMWLLTEANRLALAAGIAAGFFLLLVLASVVGPTELQQTVQNRSAIRYAFSALITAIVTAVTLVVTFNQLILSQELGAVGDQRERMQKAITFQKDIEPFLDEHVSPPTPAAFLGAVLAAVGTRATELEGAAEDTAADADIQRYVNRVRGDAEVVGDRLDGTEFGTFDVISAVLDFNYSLKIYEGRRILAEHGDVLGADVTETLESLVTVLEFFGPAREHFKTLYFQWELINLSRRILYAAVPALLVGFAMLFYVDVPDVTGSTLGIDHLVWLACAAVTVSLTPVFLLVSYILRIATITKRTLAMGPFVLQDIDQQE